MNTDLARGRALVNEIVAGLEADLSVDVAVCPPFLYILPMCRETDGSPIDLGGQNLYFAESGAYTGEISAQMLRGAQCKYVIVGHSERRSLLQESDDLIGKKIRAAIESGLAPILCVGETLDQRDEGIAQTVISNQVDGGLELVEQSAASRLTIAYEPVWAIGTGRNATPDQAQEIHRTIRELLATRYNSELSLSIRILYGGSVKPDNALDLMIQPDIDGALVGGASLKSGDFLSIINAAAESI
jgi:triosephosphate isomerase